MRKILTFFAYFFFSTSSAAQITDIPDAYRFITDTVDLFYRNNIPYSNRLEYYINKNNGASTIITESLSSRYIAESRMDKSNAKRGVNETRVNVIFSTYSGLIDSVITSSTVYINPVDNYLNKSRIEDRFTYHQLSNRLMFEKTTICIDSTFHHGKYIEQKLSQNATRFYFDTDSLLIKKIEVGTLYPGHTVITRYIYLKNSLDSIYKEYYRDSADVTIPYKRDILHYSRIFKNNDTVVYSQTGKYLLLKNDLSGYDSLDMEIGRNRRGAYELFANKGGIVKYYCMYDSNKHKDGIITVDTIQCWEKNNFHHSTIVKNKTAITRYVLDINKRDRRCTIDLYSSDYTINKTYKYRWKISNKNSYIRILLRSPMSTEYNISGYRLYNRSHKHYISYRFL